MWTSSFRFSVYFWRPAKRRMIHNFGRVCLSVSLSDDNFHKLWKFVLVLYIRCISSKYGSSSYMKVIGSRSRSQEEIRSNISIPQCKTSNGHNSGSIKHTATRFACSMRFSTTADRMVWPPSLSRDRKWPRVRWSALDKKATLCRYNCIPVSCGTERT